MKAVTKAGEQPRTCCVEDCDRAPVSQTEVMCAGHLRLTQGQNGSALPGVSNTTPIVEEDDERVLAAAAAKAAAQEQREYAERRRVRKWKTLENGTRVPEEYYTDEELAKMEEEVTARLAATKEDYDDRWIRPQPVAPPDMATMEPRWDGERWVLEPKKPEVDLEAVRHWARMLMQELGL